MKKPQNILCDIVCIDCRGPQCRKCHTILDRHSKAKLHAAKRARLKTLEEGKIRKYLPSYKRDNYRSNSTEESPVANTGILGPVDIEASHILGSNQTVNNLESQAAQADAQAEALIREEQLAKDRAARRRSKKKTKTKKKKRKDTNLHSTGDGEDHEDHYTDGEGARNDNNTNEPSSNHQSDLKNGTLLPLDENCHTSSAIDTQDLKSSSSYDGKAHNQKEERQNDTKLQSQQLKIDKSKKLSNGDKSHEFTNNKGESLSDSRKATRIDQKESANTVCTNYILSRCIQKRNQY